MYYLLISHVQIDPLAPITPARPKAGKSSSQPQPKTPIAAPSTFATRQVENSQNRRAATVLFTPHTRHRTGKAPPQQPPSPTPQSNQPPTHSTLHPFTQSTSHDTAHAGTGDLSDSDSEEGSVEAALRALDVHSRSSSGSSFPCAGRHSMHRKKVPLKPRGGAKDVWTFYKKTLGRQVCSLCE